MIDLSHYKGLIFDMDGTLVDSMLGHAEAWRQTALHYDFPFDVDAVYKMGGMPSLKMVDVFNQSYGLNLDPVKVAGRKRAIFETLRDEVTIISPSLEIIKTYQGKKKIALGTGSIKTNVDYILDKLALTEYFDAIVTADDVNNHKPAPDTFLLAAKKLGLPPDTCIVFEDTQMGIDAAKKAGMDAVLVSKTGFELKRNLPL